MRIGVICPSEIAIRRFMPALKQCDELTFAGVGVFTKEERFGNERVDTNSFQAIQEEEFNKAKVFIDQYGGKIYEGYEEICAADIDALYIPLPPALHYKWAKKALEYGKHVLVEKPSTTSITDTVSLTRTAKKNDLALHENYMFIFHEQLNAIDEIVKSGEIGEIRLYRVSFGFPKRTANDFRYNKALGGGALIDAGGYTIKYATHLLGPSAVIKYAQSNYTSQCEVDIYGSGALINDEGMTVQIAFGMDNNYKCELEIWGSKGSLTTGRILTAPVGFIPTAVIRKGNDEKTINLPSDDSFLKSIRHFITCIHDKNVREEQYKNIRAQAGLIEEFKRQAGWK